MRMSHITKVSLVIRRLGDLKSQRGNIIEDLRESVNQHMADAIIFWIVVVVLLYGTAL